LDTGFLGSGAGAGAAIAYITDPWGTRVELVQLGM